MKTAPLAAAALALALCAVPRSAHAAPPEPAPLVLERSYATDDVQRAQRLAIAALQDLGLALESADADARSLTASRLDSTPLRLTVSLADRGDSTIVASVAADYAGTPITDPRPAEAFFAAFAQQLAPPPPID